MVVEVINYMVLAFTICPALQLGSKGWRRANAHSSNQHLRSKRQVEHFLFIMLTVLLLLQVITGKGNDTYQIEGDKKEFFDDREECREALQYVDQLHRAGIDTSEFPWRCVSF